MAFTLVTTRHFERRARKFLSKHPDLTSTIRETLEQLVKDPFEPSLKLHSLTGKLSGIQAISIYQTSTNLTGWRQLTCRERSKFCVRVI